MTRQINAMHAVADTPIRIERSDNELQLQYFETVAASLSAKRALREDIRATEDRLDELEERMKSARANGTTPPRLQNTIEKTEAVLEDLERKLAAMPSPSAPKPGASTSTNHGPAFDLGSDDDEGDEEEDEYGQEMDDAMFGCGDDDDDAAVDGD